MDRHPLFHNSSSSRYVSFRPPPPPPPLSDDSGIYPPQPHRHYHHDHSHHHNRLPPPPPPPTYRIAPGPPPPSLPQQQSHLNHHSQIPRVINTPPPPPSPHHLHHHHHHHHPPQPALHSKLDFSNHLHNHRNHRLFVDNESIPPHRHHPNPVDFPQSPRVPDRIPYDDYDRRPPLIFAEFDDDSQLAHRRHLLEPLPRCPVEPHVEFDRRINYRAHNFERADRFRRVAEGISSPRFREEWSGDIRSRAPVDTPELRENRQFLDSTRENFNCRHLVSDDSRVERERVHRKHVVSDGDKLGRNVVDRGSYEIHPPIKQRAFAPKSNDDGHIRGFVPREELFRKGKGDLKEETARPGHTLEELPRLPNDLRNGILSGRNKCSDGYEKGRNRFLEASRYPDQESREESSEFVHTPKKRLVQKKSAFLRMQPAKSSFRNKNELPQNPCKGKEKPEFTDHSSSQRRKSPVQLDVSFKANALVAKAVVTPLRSAVILDDNTLSDDVKSRMDIKENPKTHIDESCANGSSISEKDERYSKNNHRARRKIMLCQSDAGISNSLGFSTMVDRSPGDSASSDSPTAKILDKIDTDGSSISEKDERHSKNNHRARRKIMLRQSGAGTSNSLGCFTMADSSPGDSAPSDSPTAEILYKIDTDERSVKTPSPISRKMRKVVISHSSQSSLQFRRKDGEENIDISLNSSRAESMSDKCLKDLGNEITSDGNSTGSPQRQLVAPLVNDADHVTASDAVLEKASGDYVSDKLSSHTDKRKSGLKSPQGSSRQSRMFDESHLSAHVSICNVGVIPSTEENSSGISITEGLHVCQAIAPVSVDDFHQEDSAGAAGCVQVSVDDIITASDVITAHCNQMNEDCAMFGTDNTSTKGGDSVKKQKSINLNDVAAPKMIGLEVPDSEAFLSLEIGILNETQNAKVTEQLPSSSKDFRSSDIPSHVATSSSSAGTPLTCDNAITTNPQDLDSLVNVDEINAVEQDCSCSSGILHEDDTTKESLKASPSVDRSTEEFFPCKGTKRKAEDPCEECSTVAGTDGRSARVESRILCLPFQYSDIIDKEGVVSEIRYRGAAQPSINEVSPIHVDGRRRLCSDAMTSVPISFDTPLSVAPLPCVQKQFSSSPGISVSTSSQICKVSLPAETQDCNSIMSPSSVSYLIPSSEEAGPSCIGSDCHSLACGCSPAVTVKNEDSRTSNDVQLAGDGGNEDGMECEVVSADNCPVDKEAILPNRGHSAFSPGSVSDLKEAGNSSMDVTNSENDILELKRNSGRATQDEKSYAVDKQTDQNISDKNIHTDDADPRLLVTEMNLDKYDIGNDDFIPSSDSLPPVTESAADGEVSMLSSLVKTLPLAVSPKTSTAFNPSLQILSTVTALPEDSVTKLGVSEQNSNQMPDVEGLSLTSSSFPCSQSRNLNSHVTDEGHQPPMGRAGSLQVSSDSAKKTMLSTVSMNPCKNERKHHPSHASTKVGSASSHLTAAKRPSTTQSLKPRTWHRTESTSTSNHLIKKPFGRTAPPKPSWKSTLKGASNSYIRKGNSLVRNPVSAFSPACHVPSASAQLLNHSGIEEGKRDQFEMLRALMLPCTSGLSSCNEVPVGPVRSSLSADPLLGTEHAVSESGLDISGPSSNPEFDLDRSFENRSPSNDGSTSSSNANKILYVKPKSNQLVAASNSSEHCMSNMDSSALSDSYYKRSKHQLVRASSESHLLQKVAVPDDSSNSEEQQTVNIQSDGNCSRRKLRGVSTRACRPHKFSLVWKLCNTESAKKSVNPLRYHKVFPHLLPWKRATYWRSFWRSSANLSNHTPSVMMSQKSLSSRKRGVIYTRSGFSIRRSKVVSLAGFSLKWSKSIERRSKKTDKEAAVASARMASSKRMKHSSYGVNTGADSHKTVDGMKPRPGERIFRIGSLRYKMDPSNRTLVRIPDKEQSSSCAAEPVTDISKCYVPKRLLIGTDEYVRIGNGNQLIRDPKRRTRVLASEKVRWSLHTARKRMARKRKYCLFFTRFGKCHKDEGKCPYIHDPSKTAICTRFLNGLCSDPNCKLTHQIIPERMPDCSFFLQGMCSNENCPYRHVNVNPKADICGGFLKGYCAEGDECRKKHTYICPSYDATGKCPEGSNCRLYHPRKGKGKKKKNSRDQICRGRRYFGLQSIAEPETVSMKHHVVKSSENISLEGSPADYISLAVSDEESRGNEDMVLLSEHAISSDIEPLNSELWDLDEPIKPVRLFNLSRGSSPTAFSSDKVFAVPAGSNRRH